MPDVGTSVAPLAETTKESVLHGYAPDCIRDLTLTQSTIPRLAKDTAAMHELGRVLPTLPTHHRLYRGDARDLAFVPDESVHLVVTSPPYWTLKQYNESDGQLGSVVEYQQFLDELAVVWEHCLRVLVPGGRVICVVGDVCLSRRANHGRHTVVPLHASIQEQCRVLGFDNLAPIIWHKIANAKFEVSGGSSFLGKPYEPNAVIKNDIEFILMQRKPGGYRSPGRLERLFSIIPEQQHRLWFRQIWTDVTGASTRAHPAPYPVALATRLIRMFSFVGDTVLDPFLGSGTTCIAAWQTGRNSVGTEIDGDYLQLAARRFADEANLLNSHHTVEVVTD